MHTFDNGLKNATKRDNWEQLFRFFRKHQYPISKSDFEPVITVADGGGGAITLLIKVYTLLTNRTVPIFVVEEPVLEEPDPNAGAQSARQGGGPGAGDATLLEPPPIAGALESMDELRSADASSGQEAYKVFQAARGHKPVERSVPAAVAERADAVPLDIAEVKARSLTKNVAQLRAQQQAAQANLQKSRNTTSMSQRKSSGGVGTDGGPSTPSLGFVGAVKAAADIMRPIVATVLQENDQVMKSLDPRKDVVVSFMELCRTHVPGDVCVRVFYGLSAQAASIADAVLKSPAEFWRVWTLYCPALVEFSESSPVFESVVYLFKRLGTLMGELEPTLTHQLILDVGLPSLAPLLIDSAGKREPLCELVYSYTQPAVLSRLGVLRGLKESIDKLPVYIACLSYFVPMELQPGLLDEHLLEHYMYYALIGLQSPEPKIRVAGLSILVTAAQLSPELAQSVLAELQNFATLVHDNWWEVQAQLLLLSARLLDHLASLPPADEDLPEINPDATVWRVGEEEPPEAEEVDEAAKRAAVARANQMAVDQLLFAISQMFRPAGASKIVLQVGLSALVKILTPYPSLVTAYTAVLLQQPAGLRQRLLQPAPVPEDGSPPPQSRRLAYVIGTSSRLYEECCICDHWPALEIARSLGDQPQLEQLGHFEPEHLEVLTACLPDQDVDIDEEWLAVFEKVKNYIFVAVLDPALHQGACDVVRRFWLCHPQNSALQAIEASKKTLLQTLRINYSDNSSGQARIAESSLIGFLREMQEKGGAIAAMLQLVIDQFREAHNAEFQQSRLDSLFE